MSAYETKKYIGSLFHTLLDKLGDMTKTDDYRKYIKLNENFKYPDDVMAKIKAHNPAWTKVTTASKWESVFGRTKKPSETGLRIEVANNLTRWLFDISQTTGKLPPSIYQNISGKAEHYQSILDCLAKFSPITFVFQQGTNYYNGIGQDSTIEDGKIVIRPNLSEQQIIFALIREIIRHNQESAVVVEAVSYMACRHLKIDTAIFTVGYMLELMGFDESLSELKKDTVQDAIHNEAEVFIGYLTAGMMVTPSGSSGGESLELSTRQKNAEPHDIPDNLKNTEIPQGTDIVANDTVASTVTQHTHSVKIHTEKIDGIDFRFIEIIRQFSNTPPDISINIEKVRKYGYTDTKMLPLNSHVATKLLASGCEIYKLHRNNTEELLYTVEEIKKHRGFFGISHDEWAATQVKILKDGLEGVSAQMNKWDRIKSGEAVDEIQKRHEAKGVRQEKAAQEKQIFHLTEELPAFDENGCIVLEADDIAFNDIENNTWLETALHQFFTQTGYRTVNMPFFANRQDFTPTPEMKKINMLMGGYCARFITEALAYYKSKSEVTGKTEYKVKDALIRVCKDYSVKHIAYAIDKHGADIKAPTSVKHFFAACFEQNKKKISNKPKKETPDEQIKRVKAAAEAKNREENTETDDTTPNNPVGNERNDEIFYIIDSYKKRLTAKPQKADNGLNALPPLLGTARQK